MFRSIGGMGHSHNANVWRAFEVNRDDKTNERLKIIGKIAKTFIIWTGIGVSWLNEEFKRQKENTCLTSDI